MKKHCNRCKMTIDTKKERHIVVEDKDGNESLIKLFFHKECWHEIMTGKSQLNNMLKRTSKIFDFTENTLGMPKDYKI